jgi:hypothetical protein
MSRMNSRNRKKYFQMIVERDGGAFCFVGGEHLTFETAIIDHLNNDNSDNRLENLHLLCPSMNSVKNCRGRDKRHQILSPMSGNIYTQMFENERLRTNSVELIINMKAEPNFKHWLFWKIIHDGTIFFEKALNGGAAFARISQETIRRYLKKELSELRFYEEAKDPDTGEKIVLFKPEWAIFRQSREEKEKMIQVVRNWKEAMNEEAFSSLSKKQDEKKTDEA